MDYLRGKFDLIPSEVPYGTAKELVAELDGQLAAHAVLFHQYSKHAWFASSPSLKALLREQSASVCDQLETLGDDIVRLGGVPISGPCEQENKSYLMFEREGLYSPEYMLDKDLNDEETLIFRLGITIETAEELEVSHTVQVLERVREAARMRGRRLREVEL